MNKQTLTSIIVIAVALIAGLIILQQTSNKSAGKPGQYDSLATCIKDSGATFYGAFWCPHCNNQKKIFEGSDKLLPYVECSNPSGNEQTQVCIDAGIQSYPTWEFADGTRMTGEVSLADLAAKAGCEATLPINTDENSMEESEVMAEVEAGASTELPTN